MICICTEGRISTSGRPRSNLILKLRMHFCRDKRDHRIDRCRSLADCTSCLICRLSTIHPLKGILKTLCWDPLRDQHVKVSPYAAITDPPILSSKCITMRRTRFPHAGRYGHSGAVSGGSLVAYSLVSSCSASSSAALSLQAAAENPFPTLLEIMRHRSFSYS